MKNYSGPRLEFDMKHDTPHASGPPHQRRNNSPTIPMAPTNQNPRQTPMSGRRHCQEELQIFVQHIVYYSSLNLDQTNTKIRQRAPAPEDLQTITRLPLNRAKAPKSHKMRFSRPKPPNPIKFLFSVSFLESWYSK